MKWAKVELQAILPGAPGLDHVHTVPPILTPKVYVTVFVNCDLTLKTTAIIIWGNFVSANEQEVWT